MMGIGFPELMIILVIIMIIFGAGKLPEIGSAFGKSIKNFKTSMKEAEEEGKLATGEQPEVAIADAEAVIADAEETKAVPEIADSSTEPAPDSEKQS